MLRSETCGTGCSGVLGFGCDKAEEELHLLEDWQRLQCDSEQVLPFMQYLLCPAGLQHERKEGDNSEQRAGLCSQCGGDSGGL